MRAQPSFGHERLQVYQSSLEFFELTQILITSLPPGHAHLADQLKRASVSICLNIAEGAGEFSKKEKARFYRISKRSATECAAILDLFRRVQTNSERDLMEAREKLFGIVSMLTALVKKLDG